MVTEDKCLLTCGGARLSRSQREKSAVGVLRVRACARVCEYSVGEISRRR